MAKSKGSKGGIRRGGVGSWSYEDHCARVTKKVASSLKRRQDKRTSSTCTSTTKDKDEEDIQSNYKRTALAHDTQHQIDTKKLGLHLSHLHREILKLRHTLTHWDEEEQQLQLQKQRQQQEQQEQAESRPRQTLAEKAARKRQKMDPSNWKLRGAARPAWEVYDFDTRYVCPFTLEHERQRERTKRMVNLVVLHRGQFGREGLPTVCRTFLSLLMQYGTLCVEAQRFRSAREAFLECIELEGTTDTTTSNTSITNARCRLIRMYIDQQRLDSARTLLDTTITVHDCSAWITYGASIVRYITWKAEENQVTKQVSNEILSQQTVRHAFESNIFLAYYLAFYDTFTTTMEYTQEMIEDAEAGTLEEAIEYCSSEQMNLWIKTEGAMEWVRTRLLYERTTSSKLLHWDKVLQQVELSTNSSNATSTTTTTMNYMTESDGVNEASEELAITNNDDDTHFPSISEHSIDQGEEVDLKMYCNMFRTAMEIIEDSGMLR